MTPRPAEPALNAMTTGRTEPIEGLPRRGDGYQLTRVAGGWAAQPFPSTGSTCANCASRPSPVYYVADGSRDASRLGAAGFVAPAAARGAVWLVSYRAGALMTATAATAQEVSVTGAALGPRRRLPPRVLPGAPTRTCHAPATRSSRSSSPTDSPEPSRPGSAATR